MAEPPKKGIRLVKLFWLILELTYPRITNKKGSAFTTYVGRYVASVRPSGVILSSWLKSPLIKAMFVLIKGSSRRVNINAYAIVTKILNCSSFRFLEFRIWTARITNVNGREVHLIKANSAEKRIQNRFFFQSPNNNKR